MPDLTQLVDDLDGVPDQEVLLRRVGWDTIGGNKPQLAGEEARLNGNAFRDQAADKAADFGFPGPCMSVAVLSILLRERKQISDLLTGWGAGYGIARLTAVDLRGLSRADDTRCPQGMRVAATDSEPWHAVVFDLSGERRPGPACKAIARIATWEIPLVHHP